MKSPVKTFVVATALTIALEIAICQHPYRDGVCPNCGKLAHPKKLKTR